jgi:hypothetical protein
VQQEKRRMIGDGGNEAMMALLAGFQVFLFPYQ